MGSEAFSELWNEKLFVADCGLKSFGCELCSEKFLLRIVECEVFVTNCGMRSFAANYGMRNFYSRL